MSATTTTQTVSREAARTLYMRIFDEFAVEVDPTLELVVEVINAKLIEALQDGGRSSDQHILADEVNGGTDGVFWQCWATYDSISRKQAEAIFDAAWPVELAEVKIDAATALPTRCACGCDTELHGKRSTFAPGHDARFAGQLMEAARQGRMSWTEAVTMAGGFSTALANKVARGEHRKGRTPKASRKAAVAAQVIAGTVKVGRWTYAAQLHTMDNGDQRLNINDVRDGSGDWLDAEGYNGKAQSHWMARFVANA
jgi:hypothetical protein